MKRKISDIQLTLPQVCMIIFSIFSILTAAVSAGNILWAKKGVEEKVEALQVDVTEMKADTKKTLANSEYVKGFFDDMVKAEVDRRTEK